MDGPGEVTLLLQRLSDGDARAADDLAPLVHDELHRLASRALASQRPDHTLQSTALLNEAWIRLVGNEATDKDWDGHDHFLGVAARAMRSVLVDHARRRGSLKRGAARAEITLDHIVLSMEEREVDLLALDEALVELSSFDADLARIVELRFYGGLNHPQIARLTGVPLRRIERNWRTARAWLYQRMTSD
ncbi:MAG: ECF-type sigma factor [Planctomycetota bacterium]